jgi:hypothetical protein
VAVLICTAPTSNYPPLNLPAAAGRVRVRSHILSTMKLWCCPFGTPSCHAGRVSTRHSEVAMGIGPLIFSSRNLSRFISLVSDCNDVHSILAILIFSSNTMPRSTQRERAVCKGEQTTQSLLCQTLTRSLAAFNRARRAYVCSLAALGLTPSVFCFCFHSLDFY